MDRILVIDPGNSTGWLFCDENAHLQGGTIIENHVKVAQLILELRPALIIYETFQLYPSKAQKLCWSTFYPVEVIGVIKYVASSQSVPLLGLQPSTKKFTIDKPEIWSTINLHGEKITEHVKDTWRLYDYWRRNH